MKKLETKYRNDELSPAELQELRNRIKSMSDYEIGEEMYQTWMNEKIDVTSVPDKQIDKIKAQIENSIKEEKSNGFDFSRIIQIAATILLPVFIILSGYLYYENRQIATKEMIVCTARGERASVTLPDGTAVAASANSNAAYNAGTADNSLSVSQWDSLEQDALQDILDRFFNYDDYLRFLNMFMKFM